MVTVVNSDAMKSVSNSDQAMGLKHGKKNRATTTVNNHTFIDTDTDKIILFFFM